IEDADPNLEEVYWDGYFNGKPVLPGVYVYMTDLLLEDDEQALYVGDITVVN
ncbi:MAG: hypothetical protein HKN09_05975, partial [Saprospiraceae bacterium]|nr:hypothetical protein [Saprospiraceae bacterium]